jgi:endogenous inhibitor of DNA gyrase (YacG/DUF329 family)
LAECRNCGKPLGVLPAKAPHKIFCSSLCRNEWHAERRKRARRLLVEAEAKAEIEAEATSQDLVKFRRRQERDWKS